jgi:hypothetical protein
MLPPLLRPTSIQHARRFFSSSSSSSPSSSAISPAHPPVAWLPKESVTLNGCRLKLIRACWGITGDLYAWFSAAHSSGAPYEAYEAPLCFLSPSQQDQLSRARTEFDLGFSALIFTDMPVGSKRTVQEHYDEFVRQIDLSLQEKPFQINSHSGLDSWSYAESLEFFTRATEYTKTIGIPVYHETHRGRALYNPWITRDLVKALPDLMLTADYSHWVNVCERLIDSEQEILTLLLPRIGHIHSRVGFEQGPQVNDPRAPEWSAHVKAHERWWKEMFTRAQQAGQRQVLTLVPEYGPGDKECHYMPKMPYTGKPLAELDEVVDWSAARMQRLFLEK